MSFEIVRAARLSWQPVKAGGSYAPEEVDRARVAGSGQAGLSNLETRHTFVLSDLFNPKNTWAAMISKFSRYYEEEEKEEKEEEDYHYYQELEENYHY